MSGYRKASLDLVNRLFSTNSTVEFEKVEHPQIDVLTINLKKLKDYVNSYYSADELLQVETQQFMKVCRRVFGTIRNYSNFFKANNAEIVHFINFTRRKAYAELYKDVVEPIINIIRELRSIETNAYLTCIDSLIDSQKINPDNTVILIKNKILDNELQFGDSTIRIMHDKEFVDEGLFVKTLLFIGTPSYFGKKFSEVFYARKNIFIAYGSFENNLYRTTSFKNIVQKEQRINTIYRQVQIGLGTHGISLKEISNEQSSKASEEMIVSQYESQAKDTSDLIEAKLAVISNNNYIFLPMLQKINVIDRDTLKITQANVKEIEKGDLLLFRTQNATTFIRDIADEILGEDAAKHRKHVELWKRKLRKIVEMNGIEKVSIVYRKKYNLDVAHVHNIKYWISSFSIKPTCLSGLLDVMNFEEDKKKIILNSTKLINSAHISAGRKISSSLMNELDKNLENIIEEKGYYTFESSEFKGASFNIEEIKKLSAKSHFIPENETLKIIKT